MPSLISDFHATPPCFTVNFKVFYHLRKPDVRRVDPVKPHVREHLYRVLPFHVTDDQLAAKIEEDVSLNRLHHIFPVIPERGYWRGRPGMKRE